MQLSGIDITFQGKDTSIHVLLIVVKIGFVPIKTEIARIVVYGLSV